LHVPLNERYAELPDTIFLSKGTDEQLNTLSTLRGISLDGLHYARLKGVLQFGRWHDLEVWAVTDRSGKLGELRRLDGQDFQGFGRFPGHKSHTLRFSRKNWPLGILEAEGAGIALVEGMPDFLAMHQFIIEEGLSGKVAPVAMLTSSCDIAPEALPHFAGKSVRIFPHLDISGIEAAGRWHKQLMDAGAKTVDFFTFHAFEIEAGSELNDLCDFNRYRVMAGLKTHILDSLV
jgi:hypothetical protein